MIIRCVGMQLWNVSKTMSYHCFTLRQSPRGLFQLWSFVEYPLVSPPYEKIRGESVLISSQVASVRNLHKIAYCCSLSSCNFSVRAFCCLPHKKAKVNGNGGPRIGGYISELRVAAASRNSTARLNSDVRWETKPLISPTKEHNSQRIISVAGNTYPNPTHYFFNNNSSYDCCG